MADKYSTIQQRQPLRVPDGWTGTEKSLVIQIDQIFDDIYRRYGRLRLQDMEQSFRKQIADDEGNIAQLMVDVGEITIEVGNKYDKVSGITITEDGIDVSGNKYVKISTQGDVWNFDNKGMKYIDSSYPNVPFQITNIEDKETITNGIFTEYSADHGDIILIACCTNNVHVSPSGYFMSRVKFAVYDEADYVDPETGTTFSGMQNYLYSPTYGNLGRPLNPWTAVHSIYYKGNLFEDYNNQSYMYFCPNPTAAKRNVGVLLGHHEVNGNDHITLSTLSGTDFFAIFASQMSAQTAKCSNHVETPVIANSYSSNDGLDIVLGPNYRNTGIGIRITETVENNKNTASINPGYSTDVFKIDGWNKGYIINFSEISSALMITPSFQVAAISNQSNLATSIEMSPNNASGANKIIFEEDLVSGVRVASISSSGGASTMQFKGNADTATKLSRAPTYGELSGR